MAAAPNLLILDDELYWLNYHQEYLERYGFTCIRTLWAKEAIALGVNFNSIEYAIIDHILRDPAQPENEKENQCWQGKEVIREITAHRKSMKFIIVTQAIGPIGIHEIEEQWMRELKQFNVINIFHKDQIKNSPNRTYETIKQWFQEQPAKALNSSIDVAKNNLSRQDVNRIVAILAGQAEYQADPKQFFNYLLRQAGLPQDWIRSRQGQWNGDINADADCLVWWAIGQGVNTERPENTTLGCILEALLNNLGDPNKSSVQSIIDFYNLMPSRGN